EARLGIAPAVISPFVLRKIGESDARALFMTAERFDAQRALHIGLVPRVGPTGELDGGGAAMLKDNAQAGPGRGGARGGARARTVLHLSDEEARETTAATIAGLRTSPEGQEGIRAFLEKRKATWVSDDVQ